MKLAYADGRNGDKPRPRFRSFYRIGEVDYEFSDFEVHQAIIDLLQHGAQTITVTRVIAEEEPLITSEDRLPLDVEEADIDDAILDAEDPSFSSLEGRI